MPYPYQNVAKFVALRSLQISGGDSAAREALYDVTDIGASMDGVEVPPSALKQDVLAQAKEIAWMIGTSNNPGFKAAIAIRSGGESYGDPVPKTGAGGVPFIGDFDGVYDDIDDLPLTVQPIQVIRRRIQNAGSFFKLRPYFYHIDGSVIYHTRAQDTYFRGCGWDEDAQSELYDTAGGLCPLPQELQVLHGALVLANIAQEDWFVADSAFWGRVALFGIQKFFPSIKAKMPSTQNRPEPVKE